ncbi:unnamed protein product, partial [Iphiclides podalirius]
MPLLFNVLGIIAFTTLSGNTYRFIRGQYSKLPRIQSITGLMLFSLVVPVALLSLFPHQEARFIIPVLLPLVYLYGNHLHPTEADSLTTRKLKNTLRCIWYTLNVLLTLFFGFVHQAGVYPFTDHLHREIKSSYGVHTHVIATHSYSIPTYLLQLESTTKIWRDKRSGRKYRLAPTTFLHRYGSLPMDELFDNVDQVLSNAEMLLHKYKRQYRFYIASPCSLEGEFREASKKFGYIDVEHEVSYYPHYCTEAFPKFPHYRDQYCLESNLHKTNESRAVDLSFYQRITCFLKRFCLRIYRDFFVDNHWERLPQSWRESVESLDPEELGAYLTEN